MTREEVLAKIIEVVEPLEELTEDTVIADSDDMDSLGLFSIVVFLKQLGKSYSLADLAKCEKVSDLIDLTLK